MPDYSKAVIYKLCCKDLTIKDIYVGSTCNFTKRKWAHKSKCNNENDKEYNMYKYKFIRDNGGWDNWDMVMLKEFNCENKRQLETEERKHFEELGATLNQMIPTGTLKEWREKNKKKLYKKCKIWKDNNKDKIAEQQKQYQLKNKQKITERKKEKIGCRICKCMVSRHGFLKHTKTKKHLNNLN